MNAATVFQDLREMIRLVVGDSPLLKQSTGSAADLLGGLLQLTDTTNSRLSPVVGREVLNAIERVDAAIRDAGRAASEAKDAHEVLTTLRQRCGAAA